ncbi:unnamed protein product, partial [Discosporangium mesarthrocarpum]
MCVSWQESTERGFISRRGTGSLKAIFGGGPKVSFTKTNPNLGELLLHFCGFVEELDTTMEALKLRSDGESVAGGPVHLPQGEWTGNPKDGPLVVVVNEQVLEDLQVPEVAAGLRRACGAAARSLSPATPRGLPVWGNDPRWSLFGHALDG